MDYFKNTFKAQIVPQFDQFVSRNFTQRGHALRYVVSSGIGANEEFTRQLAKLHNATHPDVIWIVVNNPLEWEQSKPKDATGDNTLFFDISRSGDTQETVKTFEFSYKEFPRRIVAANKGPLHALATKANTHGNILILPLPAHIGGRLMRRLTPMVYAPMYLAGMDVNAYAEATDHADRQLDFRSPRHNLAISLAEFLLTMFLANGRTQIAFLANGADRDSPLYHSMGELQQLWMEGAQKSGSPMATMLTALLPHHSHKDIEGVLAQAQSFIAFMIMAEHSGSPVGDQRLTADDVANPDHAGLSIHDVLYALALGNEETISGVMPSISIHIKKPTLQTAAFLAALYEDMDVYYCVLTGQDPNANPRVNAVRQSGAKLLTQRAAEVRGAMPTVPKGSGPDVPKVLILAASSVVAAMALWSIPNPLPASELYPSFQWIADMTTGGFLSNVVSIILAIGIAALGRIWSQGRLATFSVQPRNKPSPLQKRWHTFTAA